MTAQNTPGPWVYSIRTGKEDTHCISGPQGKVKIAEMVERNDSEKMAADARLIAAAPELLEALEGIHKALARMIDKHDPDSKEAEWLQHSNEAIRKARGIQ